jgi:hypothetical protein
MSNSKSNGGQLTGVSEKGPPSFILFAFLLSSFSGWLRLIEIAELTRVATETPLKQNSQWYVSTHTWFAESEDHV